MSCLHPQRQCASAPAFVNLTTALLARAQADNAVSVNGLSSVPRPTDPALSDLELDSSCERNTLLMLGHSGASTRMASLPDVHLTYGPMLIGVLFNMILYGVSIGQVRVEWSFRAARVHGVQALNVLPAIPLGWRMDAVLRARAFRVFYLFVVETLNTSFDMAMMDQLLVLQYGQQLDCFPRGAALLTPAVFLTKPMFVVLVSTPTHRLAFFA
ncbi:hypothetical protein B0H13DRAFT_2436868 [Mycena leptocephala]|nr:hypothetical protein B0H13DRAFT_2436868 [Mycena leptocephala]